MKKIVLIVMIMVVSLFASLTFIKAETSTFTVQTIEGASIRLVNPQGIRFAGKVTGEVSGTNVKYGMVFGNGNVPNITLDTAGVQSTFVNEVDAEGNYYISLVNVPERAYLNDITCRAYVDVDGVVTYAETQTVRNIYEIAKAAQEGGQTNTFIDNLVSSSKMTVTLYTGDQLYNHNYFVTEFMKDFNQHFGKSISAANFFGGTYTNAGSLGYEFLTSTEYNWKWGWLIEYFNEVRRSKGLQELTANSEQAIARSTIHNWLNNNDSAHDSYKCDFSNVTNRVYKYIVLPQTITLSNINKPRYDFNGWFTNIEGTGEPVTSVNSNCTLYAKYTEAEKQICNLYFNGGSTYSSREAMVDDFLNDALTYYNKTGKPVCMVDDSGAMIGFANKFNAIYGIFSSDGYGAKWTWLKEYIIQTATNDSLSSLNTGDERFWRYSLGAFLFKDHRSSWPKSQDYTNEELANGYVTLLSTAQQNNYTNVSNKPEFELPVLYKEGHTFAGWYSTSDFSGNPVTEITTETSLYAKFELLGEVFNATLNLGDGIFDSNFLANNFTSTEIILTRFNSLHWASPFNSVLFNKKPNGTYWDYICLTQIDSNLYEITHFGNMASLENVTYDLVIAYFSTGSDPYLDTIKGLANNASIGKIVVVDNIPTGESSTSANINLKIYEKVVRNTQEFTFVKDAILPTPVKNGFTFAGWYDNPEFTGEPVTTVTSSGTYYAKWNPNN